MKKFEIGDKVKVSEDSTYLPGVTGTIVSKMKYNAYRVKNAYEPPYLIHIKYITLVSKIKFRYIWQQ